MQMHRCGTRCRNFEADRDCIEAGASGMGEAIKAHAELVRIPLTVHTHSKLVADSIPGDRAHERQRADQGLRAGCAGAERDDGGGAAFRSQRLAIGLSVTNTAAISRR
jgi:hypothetical protein